MFIAFLFLLLNLSVLCIAAEVSGDYEYKVDDGNAIIINYKGTGGDVEIPGALDGYSVINIDDFAFFNRKTLTSITIPSSVTRIGRRTFYGCDALASITIPNSVTTIGEAAFSNCTSLTEITIPESVTSIGRMAFYKCTGLTTVNILNSVVGAEMFLGCTALTVLNMNENVTDIGAYAFGGCTSLQSITIPDSVENIDYGAFGGCSSLTNVIFNNPNTEFKETSGVGHPHAPLGPTFYENDNLSTMYAFSGSQAQRYALDKQLSFVPIARVQLNGQKLKFDVPPIIENGRVLVPMRAIFETFGAEIDWDGETSTVTAATSDKSIMMQMGNPQMQLNGKRMTLDVPPQIILDRTLVPVRAVSEALNATVDWNEETQTVIINIQ